MAVFGDIDIKWLGHAGFKIVYKNKVILILTRENSVCIATGLVL